TPPTLAGFFVPCVNITNRAFGEWLYFLHLPLQINMPCTEAIAAENYASPILQQKSPSLTGFRPYATRDSWYGSTSATAMGSPSWFLMPSVRMPPFWRKPVIWDVNS